MKNKIKKNPINFGKQSGTMCCFGCKDFTRNFSPEKVKMTKEILAVLFVDQINQDF